MATQLVKLTAGTNLGSERFLESLKLKIAGEMQTSLDSLVREMHEDLSTRKSFTYTPSWQASKYTNSTATKGRNKNSVVTGSPYFTSEVGERLFSAFGSEDFVRTIKMGQGRNVSLHISLANRDSLEAKTSVEGTSSGGLVGIFMPKDRGNAGKRGTPPGGDSNNKSTGVYQIAFYDEMLDHFMPRIKEVTKKAIGKTLSAYFKGVLKDMLTGTKQQTQVHIGGFNSVFGGTEGQQAEIRLNYYGKKGETK